jgi:hypothetical protein
MPLRPPLVRPLLFALPACALFVQFEEFGDVTAENGISIAHTRITRHDHVVRTSDGHHRTTQTQHPPHIRRHRPQSVSMQHREKDRCWRRKDKGEATAASKQQAGQPSYTALERGQRTVQAACTGAQWLLASVLCSPSAFPIAERQRRESPLCSSADPSLTL